MIVNRAQEDLVDSGQDENVFDNTPFAGKTKDMKNSLTSRYRKKEQVKYFTDVNLETKLWEVIEPPTRRVCKIFNLKKMHLGFVIH